MALRVKFYVTELRQRAGDNHTVFLAALADDTPESKAPFKESPDGSIVLSVVTPEAAAEFTPGDSYFVDFTPTGEKPV